MRAVTLFTYVLLSVMPTAFAQRGHPGWNRPAPTFGQPATTPVNAPVQTGTAPGTGSPATVGGGSPPASVQTGGQPAPSNQNPSAVNGGSIASVTGSSAGTQSSLPSSSDNTPAKGVIYNAANAQQALSQAPAWACDWDVTPDVSGYKFEFVPQLWGPTHTITTADTGTSDYVLFYNEPDNCSGTGGSCVGVQQTITDFTSKIKPFQTAGKKVSTPCVENPSTDYMKQFLGAFPKGSVDILCFHWYGDTLAELQSTVQSFKSIQSTYGCSELWLSEMGVNSNPSEISQYTQYLDGAVDRYAYNLYNLGAGGKV